MDLLTVAHPLEQDKPNQEECGQDWEAGSLLAGGLVFTEVDGLRQHIQKLELGAASGDQ